MALKGVTVVVVNVTSKYILCFVIIIIFYCTFHAPPFWDVFPLIGDVTNVIGHVRVKVKPLL